MAVPVFGSIGAWYADSNPAATTHNVAVPASVAANDVILLVVNWGSTGTVTPPAGFTEGAHSPITLSTGGKVKYFWKRASGADSGTYAVTFSVSQVIDAYAVRYTGCVTSGNPINVDAGAGNNSSSTTTPAQSVTTTVTDCVIVFAGYNDNGSGSWSAPSGYSSRMTNVVFEHADKAQAAAGSSGTVQGTTNSSPNAAFLVALTATSGVVTLTASTIATGAAFGAHTIAPQPVDVTVTAGIASGETFGSSLIIGALQAIAIDTVESFGSFVISGGLIASGIGTGEAFGAHTLAPQPVDLAGVAISSAEVFGAAVIIGSVLNPPTGVPSSEAFGLAVLLPQPVDINTSSILYGGVFGLAFITSISTQIRSEIITRPAPTVKYELVCVARIPQPSGPPVFYEVDPIDWTGLSYTQELSKPSQLNAGCSIAGLTDPIIQRLEDLAELASELWLYRNGKLVFAGPWLGWQVQGETLTLNGVGLLAYLDMMVVEHDMVFAQVDQFAIVTGLIDAWQNTTGAYGNFGIDTSGIAPSGVLRDATYLQKELHVVGARVAEIGARLNGFNIAVDPSSRKLRLSYPVQGVDRSIGQDAIVFDQRNVTSPNIICSAAPGDVASEGYGTGTSNNNDTVYSVQSNPTLRAQYGKTGITANFSGVSDQTTLDAHTLGMVTARSRALLIPGPDVRVTPDSDIASYDVGDVVSYQLHSRLSVQGAFRLQKRTITVSQTGQEAVSVAFV